MPPVIDKSSFNMLVKEERSFIVCAYAGGDVPHIFDEVFRRYASKVLVLVCSPNTCPKLCKYTKPNKQGAILLFSGGRLLEIISDLSSDHVWERIDRFVKFTYMREVILIKEKIFRRSRKKINRLLEKCYRELKGG